MMNKHRILSIMFTIIMLASAILPFTVFAEGDVPENIVQEVLDNEPAGEPKEEPAVEPAGEPAGEPDVEPAGESKDEPEGKPEEETVIVTDEVETEDVLVKESFSATVASAKIITTQPKTVTGEVGKTVSFKVTAKNAKAYQWLYFDEDQETWKNAGLTSMTGSNTAILKVKLNTTNIKYIFRVKVTGKDGSEELSDVVGITVPELNITAQPKSVNGEIGKTVTFKVTAENAAAYHWLYSDDGEETWKSAGLTGMTGNKTATLKVKLDAENIRYKFRVQVIGKDDSEELSDVAGITVPKLSITAQPTSVESEIGQTVTFKVTAKNAMTYQWQYSDDGEETWKKAGLTGMTGNNTATLKVKLNANSIRYKFRVKVTGKDGSTEPSDVVGITVPKLMIKTQPQEEVLSDIGKTITLTVKAENVAAYQWLYSDDNELTWKNSTLTGNKTATLKVKLTAENFKFKFRVQLFGKDGTAMLSNSASIRLLPQPEVKIVTQPKSVVSEIGKTVSFTVEAENAAAYLWKYSEDGGKTWKNADLKGMTGYKTATLKFKLTETNFNYKFYVQVTGKDGNEKLSDVVKITKPVMKITLQPRNARSKIGETVTFTVKAEYAAAYQWLYSDDDGLTWKKSTLTGNKTATLKFKLNAKNSEYKFRVKVTGKDGTVEQSDIVKVILTTLK